MRHIFSILFCCILIAVSTVALGILKPETLIRGYSSVVEVIGKSQLTSNFSLIGERYDDKDDYTGGYKCSAENETGQDVVYGGCSLKAVKLKISGEIDKKAGKIKIYTRNGKSIGEIAVDENGCFDEELEFDGGDNYIFVQYDKFSGSIDFKTEYA